MTAGFTAALLQAQTRISTHMEHRLPQTDLLHQAMTYALRGGKMLRGFLVLESARLHDVPETAALEAALAIECIHAYSLVHDDLPCMDDDDLRRGQPTLHRKWDEATAVLAGDSLQTLAFELLAREEVGPHAISLIRTMAEAAGKDGMVSGQMLDIAAETAEAPLTLEQITTLQARKTGCLIEWSACAGARLAGADPAPLRHYAQALGLAFQIADDILDIEGDAATVGKAVRKDEDAGKATFVSLLGLEGAKRRAQELADQACAALAPYGAAGDTLKDAARFVISRDS
ncbi:Octaprenyl diphosphate synthase / Dimethylallyltransferase / (2E,6E)-farnesyl diphosphate synthase / Geranylgeranyl diphosphate synthase [Tritonibacter mobilis]|uniref:polyprenyl synthetase family protein n=1 Tax=Tritonibacter mobilis TaxID=379347 RepID=UPI000F6DE245|nr:farnesyl diphosphate synthase [Tritonibacter mobilis]VCU57160.1 Octaprenyl diphosphate synthase / Dimethylallyltransferase / (2E,6E)-farnesyl diphosphate synthase / Geranylgeranyl diphosphate synthase [Tritonibacter mobilis]